jgi:hypothetical protein
MRRRLRLVATILAGCVSIARAQTPDAGGAGGTGGTAGGAGGAGVAAAAGEKKGLLGRIFKGPEARAKCRKWFCDSPAGQLVNNLLKPISGLTGGLIPPLCKQDGKDPEKLKQPAESAAGASERIKAEEAGAKAKIADLEYLSTKNCKRFPEAEAALIAGLRAEKLECVRLAAAKALLSGCCCTPKIIKALTTCVNRSEKDGNLAEESERVRLTAFVALERCLRVCQATKVEEPPEKPKGEKKGPDLTQAAYAESETTEIYADARAALARGISVSDAVMQQVSGPANLRDLLVGPTSRQAAVAAPPVYPPLPPADAPLPTEAGRTPPDEKPPKSLLSIVKGAIGK